MKSKNLEEKFYKEFEHCTNLEFENEGFIFVAGYTLAQKEIQGEVGTILNQLRYRVLGNLQETREYLQDIDKLLELKNEK